MKPDRKVELQPDQDDLKALADSYRALSATPEFKEQVRLAQQLIAADDIDGLAALASANVEERARLAAENARKSRR